MTLKHRKYIICFILHFFLYGDVFDGYTLFTPLENNADFQTTYLINNDNDIINLWTHEYGAASMPYLLPDSSIIYPYRVPHPTMDVGGVGGGIQNIKWNGTIIWDYTFSNDIYHDHLVVEPLQIGIILIFVWE